MRQKLTTALEVAGLVSLTIGAGMLSLAVGCIVGGACAVLVGYLEGGAA
jgi:hypothetical protein